MHLEVAAVLNPMHAAAEVGRIRNQIRNSRELFKIGEKRTGIQALCQSSCIRTDYIWKKCKLIVVGLSIEKFRVAFRSIDGINFGQHLAQGLRIEKIINHDMREWLVGGVDLVLFSTEFNKSVSVGLIIDHGAIPKRKKLKRCLAWLSWSHYTSKSRTYIPHIV